MTNEMPPFDPALDIAYNARASVASFEDEFAELSRLSRVAKKQVPAVTGLVFDPQSGEKLDLYGAGTGAPVVLWIHGGYWRAGTKEDNAFAVPGFAAQGIGVAVMDYTLAPGASLLEITRQTRQAVKWLKTEGPRYGFDVSKIHIAGHSAGGHLVGMLLMDDWQESFDLPSDIIGASLAISGLFDLAPLLRTEINEWMKLDVAGATGLSPQRHIPASTTAKLVVAVGGDETAEFQSQTTDYLAAWTAAGFEGTIIDMPGCNHFSVSGALADRENPMSDCMAKLIRGANS